MRALLATLLVLTMQIAFAAEEWSTVSVVADRVEHHFDDDKQSYDLSAMHKTDSRAVVLRFEGSKSENEDLDGELQLLLSKPWTAYFDWQIGLEAGLHDGETTPGIVAGIVGDAPYRIETEARVTLNDEGELFLHAEFERDFLLTQDLVLQPRLGVVIGDDEDELAVELRLRYEISRKFVPYVGVSWERIFVS